MPSRVPNPDPLAMSSWRSAKSAQGAPQPATYSTAQQERLWPERGPQDAVLLGGAKQSPSEQQNGTKRTQPSKPKTASNGKGQRLPPSTTPTTPASRQPPKAQRRGQKNMAAQLRQGGKRHLDQSPQSPARRVRRGIDDTLVDEAYIRRTYKLPTRAEYPNAPQDLITQPKGGLMNSAGRVLNLRSDYAPTQSGNFRCTVTCQVPDRERFEVFGEGPNKRVAERAAYLHLLSELHSSGVLKELYAVEAEIDKQTLQDEADAKADIYNYAARFDSVPQFSVREVARPLRARGKKLIEVTVVLPEQGITVSARGQNLQAAEIAASVRFKAEAEKHHSQNGEDVIVIKDSTALNTGNVKSFFEFFKIVNKTDVLEAQFLQTKGKKGGGSAPFACQIMLNNERLGEPAEMTSKKKAEELAWLTAAIAIKRGDPEMFPAFLQALRAGNGDILKPVVPVDLTFDSESAVVVRETLHEARKAGLPDVADEVVSEEELEETRRVRTRRQLSPPQMVTRNIDLQKRHEAFLQKPELAELRQKKAELPMNQYRAQVIDLVENNTYSIVVGATGSGKTTQVPQILLEKAIGDGSGARCNIICTQPRRIAATSVARRVAEERDEPLQRSVGYQVRFDAKVPQLGGSVTYCTTGILLQQLQHSPNEILNGTSHLIIDEVHERDILIDFLLIILKTVMRERAMAGKSTPHVVLMSATMDTELFAGYFKRVTEDGSVAGCPSLSVPGRTFPVKENYVEGVLDALRKTYPNQLGPLNQDPATREYIELEQAFGRREAGSSNDTADEGEAVIDWKRERVMSSDGGLSISNEREDALVPIGLVAVTVAHIAKISDEGAVLVFLPGLDEIVNVDKLLRQQRPLGIDFNDESRFKISMLHSSIPAGQTDVFNPVPAGCRKVILATNIAETSITIPDVQYVVDTGKLREKRYDQTRRITKLQCTWISKSNSKQRAGRAGRVQNGNYYALFSKARYDALRAIGLPEMLRSDLQEICLDIKAQAFKSPIREFLSQAIEPPSPLAVDASVTGLQGLEALTDEEQLTPLGRLLASLPVHPALGKMIVLGVIFRCLDPMLILGAAGAERSMFVTPLEARREAAEARHAFAGDTGSDHISLINAFREMRMIRDRSGMGAMMDFGRQNFIHNGSFRTIDQTAKQIEDILVEAGLIPYTAPRDRYRSELGHPSLNENAAKVPLVKALALAGMHPNLAVNVTGRLYRTPGEKGTMVHPSSINYPRGRDDEDSIPRGTLLTYSTMTRSADGKSIFLRDTSRTSALMAALFGGRLRSSASSANVLEMDQWLPFYVRDRADGRALKTIVEFRKALDRLLTGAFQDLSKRGGEGKGYLADAKAREVFAQGLVEVSVVSQLAEAMADVDKLLDQESSVRMFRGPVVGGGAGRGGGSRRGWGDDGGMSARSRAGGPWADELRSRWA
ncbi:MAG: ATP-dependent RNA helicase A [Thelocarpon impressellum]|nr:MAG: ATP-dependent RNA helicase A [Thelocarpon impressellum]